MIVRFFCHHRLLVEAVQLLINRSDTCHFHVVLSKLKVKPSLKGPEKAERSCESLPFQDLRWLCLLPHVADQQQPSKTRVGSGVDDIPGFRAD